MKQEKRETELRHGKRNRVPILASGIGTRIAAAADAVGTRKSAAQAAGVSTDSLQRYIREEVHPTFEAMAGLAAASGFSLEWLATGEGGVDPVEVREPGADYGAGPDGDLVAQVAAELYELVMTEGLALPPQAFAICVRAATRLKVKEPDFAVRDVIRDVLGP